jgi:hypothetical protein
MLLDTQLAMQEHRFSVAQLAHTKLAELTASALGAGSCKLLPIAQLQAELEMREKRPSAARATAQAALEALSVLQVDPLLIARLQITLAASLPAGELARSRTLLAEARAALRDDPRAAELEQLWMDLVNIK